ncbi:unnamed protein product [Lactuca virosa]|uniref:Uncharacterized protein n=1 Tax=Lactuca virosa TaxID=75947 RepID=A0AAU9LSK4_9ASTR|nr:unnamed protein product [Lactuca virosa]
MGSDVESDPISIPKLQLFSMALPRLPEPSGMLTPPLQTSASVPFRWEEQPGKPRPCTDLILHTTTTAVNRCLELPPRLTMVESNIITKTPSPTTVLDGPGDTGGAGNGKSIFSSSSFRFARERRRKGQRQGSFDSNCSGVWSPTDDSSGGGHQLLLPAGDKQEQQKVGRGLFGSFRLRGSHKPKDVKDSFVISPSSVYSMDTVFLEKKGKRMRRNSSLSKLTRSHFWTAIYEGFKQVVPWKKKHKKESFHV